MKILDIPQSGKRGLTVSQNGRYGQISRALVIPTNPRTPFYTAKYGVPAVGTKIFVQCNQFVNGFQSVPASFWAIVPAAA